MRIENNLGTKIETMKYKFYLKIILARL